MPPIQRFHDACLYGDPVQGGVPRLERAKNFLAELKGPAARQADKPEITALHAAEKPSATTLIRSGITDYLNFLKTAETKYSEEAVRTRMEALPEIQALRARQAEAAAKQAPPEVKDGLTYLKLPSPNEGDWKLFCQTQQKIEREIGEEYQAEEKKQLADKELNGVLFNFCALFENEIIRNTVRTSLNGKKPQPEANTDTKAVTEGAFLLLKEVFAGLELNQDTAEAVARKILLDNNTRISGTGATQNADEVARTLLLIQDWVKQESPYPQYCIPVKIKYVPFTGRMQQVLVGEDDFAKFINQLDEQGKSGRTKLAELAELFGSLCRNPQETPANLSTDARSAIFLLVNALPDSAQYEASSAEIKAKIESALKKLDQAKPDHIDSMNVARAILQSCYYESNAVYPSSLLDMRIRQLDLFAQVA